MKKTLMQAAAMLVDTQVSSPSHGLVAMADAASFNNTFFSEPLTTYAQGWRDPTNIDAILDFLFPAVQVPRRFEFRKHDDSADFLVDSDDERSLGADFKRVKYSGSIQQSKTANKGLTMFVDADEIVGMPNWQQVYTGRLLRRCKRNDLYAGVNLLIAGAANTAKTWDGTADPDGDLVALVQAGGDLLGFNPNRLAFFGAAWTKRLTSMRAQDKAGATSSLMLRTADEVAAYVGAQRGMIVDARVKLPDASTKSKLGGGNYAVAFYAEDGVGPEDPSATKRFWTPCGDGSQYRVYVRQVSEKLWSITVERYNKLAVTSTVGLVKYTVS